MFGTEVFSYLNNTPFQQEEQPSSHQEFQCMAFVLFN